MKTIVNRSRKPIRIPLPGNKTLFLGPSKSGQLSDQQLAAPAVARLLKSGDIEVVGEAAHPGGGGGGSETGHEATHGHQPRKVVLPKGDR